MDWIELLGQIKSDQHNFLISYHKRYILTLTLRGWPFFAVFFEKQIFFMVEQNLACASVSLMGAGNLI